MKLIVYYIIALIIISSSSVEAATPLSCASVLRGVNVRIAMRQAKLAFDRRDYEESLSYLEDIIAQDSEDYRALSLVSNIYHSQGRLLEAIKIKLKVIELEPIYKEPTYMSLVRIYFSLNNYEEALKYLDIVLEKNPDHQAALGMKARAHLSLEQYIEAYSAIWKKSELSSPETNTHAESLKVEYFYQLGQKELALKRANVLVNSFKPRKGQRRVPKAYTVGLAARAKVLTSLGRSNEAIKDLEELEVYFGSKLFVPLLRLKAEAHFQLGKVTESKNILIDIIRNSTEKDLMTVAALVRIEQLGDKMDIQSPLLTMLFQSLDDREAVLVMKLAKETDWDYIPVSDLSVTDRSMINTFWSSLYSRAVDKQTLRATY